MKREQRLNCKPIISALNNQGFTKTGIIPPGVIKKNTILKTGMPHASTIIMGFFPIDITKRVNISSFAARNYYKEMIFRMKEALRCAGPPFSVLTKREILLFSNSSLPEKELAEAGGLGFTGRNTLLLNSTHGSRGLLAGMILPLEMEEDLSDAVRVSGGCGNCRACEESCPGSALQNYRLNRENCLQHWTSREGDVPDRLKEVWGNRIYGCTICQDVCPWNKKVPPGNTIQRGMIDPEPDLSFYLSRDEGEVKEHFRGTAMGMKWFKGNSMIRNAILSVPSSEVPPPLVKLVEGHKESEDRGIRAAALWALKKIRPDLEH